MADILDICYPDQIKCLKSEKWVNLRAILSKWIIFKCSSRGRAVLCEAILFCHHLRPSPPKICCCVNLTWSSARVLCDTLWKLRLWEKLLSLKSESTRYWFKQFSENDEYCQRHNGPKGWVLPPKLLPLSLSTLRFKSLTKLKPQKLIQTPASSSCPKLSFEHLTKFQLQFFYLTSKSWPNFSFKIVTKLHLQNLD